MPVSEKKKISDARYKKANVKRIPLDVLKSYYDDILKPAADMMDEPVNTFIKKAIEERLDRIYKEH